MDKPPTHATEAKRKRMSIPAVVALDLLCIIAGLNVFAYFHHVRDYYFPQETTPVALITPAPAAPSPVPAGAPEIVETEPTETIAPAGEKRDLGMWGEKFADQFTDGEIILTDNSYKSAHVSVTVTKVEEKDLVYHVAEIYVSDIKYLRSALGEKGYGSRGMTADLAAANNAVIAISGDYYSARQEGIVVRNGVLYRETPYEDICVLLTDGRMLTLSRGETDLEQLREAAPWQVWSFGPGLLDNGAAMTEFNSTVKRKNPRSAIGYAEPGHYFFLQADGRNAFGSLGLTLARLSEIFEDLGCQTAYNLDGGQTAGIAWCGELLSYPYGRSVSDIIYITDDPVEG